MHNSWTNMITLERFWAIISNEVSIEVFFPVEWRAAKRIKYIHLFLFKEIR